VRPSRFSLLRSNRMDALAKKTQTNPPLLIFFMWGPTMSTLSLKKDCVMLRTSHHYSWKQKIDAE
jgi:hypothetical protein